MATYTYSVVIEYSAHVTVEADNETDALELVEALDGQVEEDDQRWVKVTSLEDTDDENADLCGDIDRPAKEV